MQFLEWWASLSAWIRYPVAFLVILVSTIGFAILRGEGYYWGRILGLGWALGFILLIIGPSKAD